MALAEAIFRQTEGNPLFIQEVARYLAESGLIKREGGQWVASVDSLLTQIPEGLRDVIGKRLTRLSEDCNRILSIAAVHEVLAQEGFRLVNVKDVMERIAQTVSQNMLRPDLHAEILVEGEAVVLPSRAATALALVVNELLQNALEHAFVGRSQGEQRHCGQCNADTGPGSDEVLAGFVDEEVSDQDAHRNEGEHDLRR